MNPKSTLLLSPSTDTHTKLPSKCCQPKHSPIMVTNVISHWPDTFHSFLSSKCPLHHFSKGTSVQWQRSFPLSYWYGHGCHSQSKRWAVYPWAGWQFEAVQKMAILFTSDCTSSSKLGQLQPPITLYCISHL